MRQKIIKVGNSAAVTLPASFLREAGLAIGAEVLVEPSASYKTILIKPLTMTAKSLTPEFFSWLEKTAKKYEKVIKELART